MGSKLKIILKFFFGLLLGLIPAMWIIQNNKNIKKITIEPIIKHLEKKWNAKIKLENPIVDIFSGTFKFNNLEIKSCNKTGCCWQCKNGSIQILKRSSLKETKLNLHITLNKNNIETEYKNGNLGLFSLLRSIFKNQPDNFDAKSFTITDIHIKGANTPQNPTVTCNGNLYVKKNKNNLWRGRFSVTDGAIALGDSIICNDICGITQFYEQEKSVQMDINHTLKTPFCSPNHHCSLTGKWSDVSKSITFKNNQKLFSIQLTSTNDTLSADTQINIEKFAFLKDLLPLIKDVSTHFSYKNNILNIMGASPYGNYRANIHLGAEIKLNKFTITKKDKTVAHFCSSAENKQTICGSISYAFLQSLLPINVRQWMLGNKGVINLEINKYSTSQFCGKVRFSRGKIHIPGSYNLITNFSADFDIDIHAKQLKLSNIVIDFYKGSAISKQALFFWDKKITFFHVDLQIKNFLANWQDDFFGVLDGNFLIKSSGNNLPINVFGDVIIKKSLIKENIFSQGTSQKIMGNLPIHLDLNISNEEQLAIRTPFLKTQATTDLNIKIRATPNILSTPKFAGTITLRHGTLIFPSNKLFITSGKITFIPTQINNPMVYLVAKNRIKKYVVTLHATGPWQKPTIFLESTPELTEEQIISLLFADSENVTLQSQLPAIIMQNLSTFILSNKKLFPITTSFFQKLTKPLKYIQISPNFSNQSGRGGVVGKISIDINKQLHARIEKNLSMQDDFSFLLEYFLSDNFNVKAIKDHREDIGAEVEFLFP